MSAEDSDPAKDPAHATGGKSTVAGITVEEFLSTLTGKPTKETLTKIRAAMADPNSEIHPFLRAFEKFAKRARDPDAINWQTAIQAQGHLRQLRSHENDTERDRC